MSTGNGTAPPRCCAPDCPSPAFRAEEAKPHGHAVAPDGSTYHFGCAFNLRAAAELPTTKPAEQAVKMPPMAARMAERTTERRRAEAS